MFDFVLFAFDLHALPLDVQTQPIEDRHILIRNPNQGEEREEISAPVGIDQLKPSNEQKAKGDPVTEAVLTGEQIKKLPLHYVAALPAAARAEFARLAEHLLVRNGPTDAGNGNRNKQQLDYLQS